MRSLKKKVKIQKKQRKIFCIPVNIVLCSLFLKAFVFHILRVFVFPAFLLLWFFALQKKPKLSSRSTKQIRVDITTTTTSATLERSITCDLGNVTQKRVYSVSMTHPDFLLSRLLTIVILYFCVLLFFRERKAFNCSVGHTKNRQVPHSEIEKFWW